MMRLAPLALVLVAACAGDTTTSIRLDVEFDDGWTLENLHVSMLDREVDTDVLHELVVLVPDATAGQSVDIAVDGVRNGLAWATGAVTVVPTLGAETSARIRLTREVCGGEAPEVCDEAPDATCVDDSTLRVYESVGTCASGTCAYESHDVACANCPNCDPCASVVCSAPPPAACVDSMTLRTYDSAGTCSDGACDYSFTDTPCAAGCANGACVTGCSPSGWSQPQQIGPAWADSETSLAIDASGGVHVAYTADVSGEHHAMYATKAQGSWQPTPLEPSDYNRPSLALGPGGPEVAYGDSERIRLAVRQPGGGWTPSTIGTPEDESLYRMTTLQVTSSGERLVAYHHLDVSLQRNSLRFVSKSSSATTWSRRTLHEGDGDFLASTLALDGSMHVVARYNDPSQTSDRLDYWVRDPGGTWTGSSYGAGRHCAYSAIVLDANLTAHIACRNDQGVRYIRRTAAGQWYTSVVDSEASSLNRGGGLGIAIDRFGRIHIVYRDYENINALTEVVGNGTTWTESTIAASGSGATLRSDGEGRLHLVYVASGAVKYTSSCPAP